MDTKTNVTYPPQLLYDDIPQAATRVETLCLSIVSNSKLLREGLPTLLAPFFRLTLVGAYCGEPCGEAEHHHGLTEHIVVVDSRIGQQQALAWARFWRKQQPPAFVVIMELADDPRMIVDCIAAGGCAYTLQGASIAELAETMSLARQGLARCSPQVTAQLFARLEAVENSLSHLPHIDHIGVPLSYRELEILRSIARGRSNKEIAAELVISLYTVKHHVHNILEKLKLSQRRDAVRLATEQGWLEVD